MFIDLCHAHRVFNHFDMTDLRDYHNFYLLTDVLLLADVFESFRDVCLQHYDLDPAHNYTPSVLSWQAALKMTDVELNLFTDFDQHLFIDEGSREGWQWSATDMLEPMPLARKTMTPAKVVAT